MFAFAIWDAQERICFLARDPLGIKPLYYSCDESRRNFLFASESALLALVGSIAGYLLGCGIAFWIGKANFDAAILPQPLLLFPVLLGSVALALVASTAPLRLLQQIQPAGILRGE